MRYIKKYLIALASIFFAFAMSSCVKEEAAPDNSYGYVQFKLYKEASYISKASFDYLSDIAKIQVNLVDESETLISQTLVLTSAGGSAAEYGLRSAKLQLLAGEYKVLSYSLCDKNDNSLVTESPAPELSVFTVVGGGLVVHDLTTASVQSRGFVKFTMVKDMSGFENNPQTKASSHEFNLADVHKVTVEVRNTNSNVTTEFEKLPVKFNVDFDDDPDTDGYQISNLLCDSLVTLVAGDYTISKYILFDQNQTKLEINTNVQNTAFVVKDNEVTETKVPVKLYETAEYIKDYYALYELWVALDGPNWFYSGEDYPRGANWDFNKDPDLWGAQPGVVLHPNGRVARINISDFGFRGRVPEAIGQFSELIELYLGTHNDKNTMDFDPTLPGPKAKSFDRMAAHKEYLRLKHPAMPLSEPIGVAMCKDGIDIPEVAIYKNAQDVNNNLVPTPNGFVPSQRDLVPGKLCNGLEEIDPAIGKLTKLERLYIANGKLKNLPMEMKNLKSLTDLELYNCPEMKTFPTVISMMPALISVNFSSNPQWNVTEANKAIKMIAEGASRESIQILYMTENNISVLPASMKNMKKLGLLDLTDNEISVIEAPFGKNVSLVQAFFSKNKITSFPTDSDGLFCKTDDMEVFAADFNQLTKVPDIFDAKSIYTIGSVSLAYNHIDGFENEDDGYRGMNVTTLTLNNNAELTTYPVCLAKSGSKIENLNFRGCSLNKIPKGSFVGDGVINISSIDFSYNHLSSLPREMNSANLPYLYGIDLSYNRFNYVPIEPFDSFRLTIFAIRGQRNANGERILREWPEFMADAQSVRAFYIGGNDLGVVKSKISPYIMVLDISDNPNIIFDASSICYYYRTGELTLIYDKDQEIRGCEYIM